MNRLLGLIGLFALAAGLLWLSTLAAEEQPAHPKSGSTPVESSSEPSPVSGPQSGPSLERAQLHGGRVTATKAHIFETVVSWDGIRIYRYTASQAPVEIDQAAATATIASRDGTKKDLSLVRRVPAEGEPAVYFCPMHEQVIRQEPGICGTCGGMNLIAQDYLYGEANLSQVDPVAMTTLLRIEGLGGEEPAVTFALAPLSAAASSAAPAKSSPEAGREEGGH